jgi:hypothetical protein
MEVVRVCRRGDDNKRRRAWIERVVLAPNVVRRVVHADGFGRVDFVVEDAHGVTFGVGELAVAQTGSLRVAKASQKVISQFGEEILYDLGQVRYSRQDKQHRPSWRDLG